MKKQKRYYDKIKIMWGIFYRLCAMRLFSIFPIHNNKIVFRSYSGTKYSDSPKYISEALYQLADKKHKAIDIVWIVTTSVVLPQNVRRVKHGSLRSIYELATAKVWVDNTRKELWNRKRKGQYYIQTWHSSVALKKVEKDAEDKLNWSYIKAAKLDSQMIDIFLSGSKWRSVKYKESFWYEGTVWESGLPRADLFYRSNYSELIKNVKSYFHMLDNDHVVVYAPTFRNNNKFSFSDINYNKIVSTLNTVWGGNWKLIVRLHPNWASKQNEISYNSSIVNGSNYPEINELLLASNLLITDYSSCMFDAMEAKKPVILYAPDAKNYWDERGCYFNFSQLPFPLTNNQNELIECIKNFDFNIQKEKVGVFMKEIGFVNDGKASERVANLILEKM